MQLSAKYVGNKKECLLFNIWNQFEMNTVQRIQKISLVKLTKIENIIILDFASGQWTENQQDNWSIGEPFKYYFADFVHLKWGPPPPLQKKIRQKSSYGFGGYPPPLHGISPKKFFKWAKNGVFCSKNA